jgi:hypothetical protein
LHFSDDQNYLFRLSISWSYLWLPNFLEDWNYVQVFSDFYFWSSEKFSSHKYDHVIKSFWLILLYYIILGWGTHALHGSTSPHPPPSPVSQPAFILEVWCSISKFLLLFLFFCCGFFYWTKSFIDIDY